MLAVVLLVQVDTACAAVVYQGKSGDIFEAGSSAVAHQEKVRAIIGKVGQAKGVGMLQIQLTLAVFAAPNGNAGDLAEERCQVLKNAINARYSVLKIECDTETKHLDSPVQALVGANVSPQPSVDNLILQMVPITTGQASGVNAAGKPDLSVDLEPWQKDMRKRYEAIVAKHKDCEWFPPPKHCDIDCDPVAQKGKEFGLCMMRAYRCELTAGSLDSLSVEILEYEIGKLRVLQETTPEVYALAKEIYIINDNDIGIAYESNLLKREIESNIIALKYINRALKKTELGIKGMGKINDDQSELLSPFFQGLVNNDVAFAVFYQSWYRLVALDHVKKIHNFVRTSIGLDAVNYEDDFPICMFAGSFTNVESGGPKESSEWYKACEMAYRKTLLPDMLKYGYHELPLE